MKDQILNLPYHLYSIIALFILFYMIVWYILSQIKKDASIVDIAWGLGFICISFVVEFVYKTKPNIVLFSIVTIWGIRLAFYILIRSLNKGEDWRYKQWRKTWGAKWWIISFFKVFLLQGIFMFFIALPLMVIHSNKAEILPIQYLGVVLWLFGFLWESISDYQLYQFKKNPANKEKIMKRGLWKFSRHPNYFGEIVLWWGIFIYTIPYGYWALTILSPVLMTWLLTLVTGVNMLESKYKDNPKYQEYIKQTNALIPKFF